jgi:hypothetical protein
MSKEIPADSRPQRLIERMRKANYDGRIIKFAEKLITELQQTGVYYIDRFIQKLMDRANNDQEFFDILMEGRFALLLAANKFSRTYLEHADDEPDVKSDWDEGTVYFEVTRRRPNKEDRRFTQPGAHFVGPTRNDATEIVLGRIQDKLGQLKVGGINVVVYCSENVSVGEPDMEEAFKYIREEINGDPERYLHLSGVLFSESVVDMSLKVPLTRLGLGGFRVFVNNNASRPLVTSLKAKLESMK